ncbi:MAG: hypothetical protein JSS50_03465 [Proteobacteria bacterium]|nr:hypothetical protein [Pseudomonadota bacterium]
MRQNLTAANAKKEALKALFTSKKSSASKQVNIPISAVLQKMFAKLQDTQYKSSYNPDDKLTLIQRAFKDAYLDVCKEQKYKNIATVAITFDENLAGDALQNAFEQYCKDVHNNYRPDKARTLSFEISELFFNQARLWQNPRQYIVYVIPGHFIEPSKDGAGVVLRPYMVDQQNQIQQPKEYACPLSDLNGNIAYELFLCVQKHNLSSTRYIPDREQLSKPKTFQEFLDYLQKHRREMLVLNIAELAILFTSLHDGDIDIKLDLAKKYEERDPTVFATLEEFKSFYKRLIASGGHAQEVTFAFGRQVDPQAVHHFLNECSRYRSNNIGKHQITLVFYSPSSISTINELNKQNTCYKILYIDSNKPLDDPLTAFANAKNKQIFDRENTARVVTAPIEIGDEELNAECYYPGIDRGSTILPPARTSSIALQAQQLDDKRYDEAIISSAATTTTGATSALTKSTRPQRNKVEVHWSVQDLLKLSPSEILRGNNAVDSTQERHTNKEVAQEQERQRETAQRKYRVEQSADPIPAAECIDFNGFCDLLLKECKKIVEEERTVYNSWYNHNIGESSEDLSVNIYQRVITDERYRKLIAANIFGIKLDDKGSPLVRLDCGYDFISTLAARAIISELERYVDSPFSINLFQVEDSPYALRGYKDNFVCAAVEGAVRAPTYSPHYRLGGTRAKALQAEDAQQMRVLVWDTALERYNSSNPLEIHPATINPLVAHPNWLGIKINTQDRPEKYTSLQPILYREMGERQSIQSILLSRITAIKQDKHKLKKVFDVFSNVDIKTTEHRPIIASFREYMKHRLPALSSKPGFKNLLDFLLLVDEDHPRKFQRQAHVIRWLLLADLTNNKENFESFIDRLHAAQQHKGSVEHATLYCLRDLQILNPTGPWNAMNLVQLQQELSALSYPDFVHTGKKFPIEQAQIFQYFVPDLVPGSSSSTSASNPEVLRENLLSKWSRSVLTHFSEKQRNILLVDTMILVQEQTSQCLEKLLQYEVLKQQSISHRNTQGKVARRIIISALEPAMHKFRRIIEALCKEDGTGLKVLEGGNIEGMLQSLAIMISTACENGSIEEQICALEEAAKNNKKLSIRMFDCAASMMYSSLKVVTPYMEIERDKAEDGGYAVSAEKLSTLIQGAQCPAHMIFRYIAGHDLQARNQATIQQYQALYEEHCKRFGTEYNITFALLALHSAGASSALDAHEKPSEIRFINDYKKMINNIGNQPQLADQLLKLLYKWRPKASLRALFTLVQAGMQASQYTESAGIAPMLIDFYDNLGMGANAVFNTLSLLDAKVTHKIISNKSRIFREWSDNPGYKYLPLLALLLANDATDAQLSRIKAECAQHSEKMDLLLVELSRVKTTQGLILRGNFADALQSAVITSNVDATNFIANHIFFDSNRSSNIDYLEQKDQGQTFTILKLSQQVGIPLGTPLSWLLQRSMPGNSVFRNKIALTTMGVKAFLQADYQALVNEIKENFSHLPVNDKNAAVEEAMQQIHKLLLCALIRKEKEPISRVKKAVEVVASFQGHRIEVENLEHSASYQKMGREWANFIGRTSMITEAARLQKIADAKPSEIEEIKKYHAKSEDYIIDSLTELAATYATSNGDAKNKANVVEIAQLSANLQSIMGVMLNSIDLKARHHSLALMLKWLVGHIKRSMENTHEQHLNNIKMVASHLTSFLSVTGCPQLNDNVWPMLMRLAEHPGGYLQNLIVYAKHIDLPPGKHVHFDPAKLEGGHFLDICAKLDNAFGAIGATPVYNVIKIIDICERMEDAWPFIKALDKHYSNNPNQFREEIKNFLDLHEKKQGLGHIPLLVRVCNWLYREGGRSPGEIPTVLRALYKIAPHRIEEIATFINLYQAKSGNVSSINKDLRNFIEHGLVDSVIALGAGDSAGQQEIEGTLVYLHNELYVKDNSYLPRSLGEITSEGKTLEQHIKEQIAKVVYIDPRGIGDSEKTQQDKDAARSTKENQKKQSPESVIKLNDDEQKIIFNDYLVVMDLIGSDLSGLPKQGQFAVQQGNNWVGVYAKDLTMTQLRQHVQLCRKDMEDAIDRRDKQKLHEAERKLLALSCVAKYRTSGKLPRLEQIVSTLGYMMIGSDVFEKIATGEGKTISSFLSQVWQWGFGDTVVALTQSQFLAEELILENGKTCQYMGIQYGKTPISSTNTDPKAFVVGGINTSTPGDFVTYFTEMLVLGQAKMMERVVLNIDEADILTAPNPPTNFCISMAVDPDYSNLDFWKLVYAKALHFMKQRYDPDNPKRPISEDIVDVFSKELEQYIRDYIQREGDVTTDRLNTFLRIKQNKLDMKPSEINTLLSQAVVAICIVRNKGKANGYVDWFKSKGSGDDISLDNVTVRVAVPLDEACRPHIALTRAGYTQNLVHTELNQDVDGIEYEITPITERTQWAVSRTLFDMVGSKAHKAKCPARKALVSATQGPVQESSTQYGITTIAIPRHKPRIVEHTYLHCRYISEKPAVTKSIIDADPEMATLILCKSIEEADALYRYLNEQYEEVGGYAIKKCTGQGAIPIHDIVTLAGKKRTITVATSILTRGADAVPEDQVKGLRVIDLTGSVSTSDKTQGHGRSARSGIKGKIVEVICAEEVKQGFENNICGYSAEAMFRAIERLGFTNFELQEIRNLLLAVDNNDSIPLEQKDAEKKRTLNNILSELTSPDAASKKELHKWAIAQQEKLTEVAMVTEMQQVQVEISSSSSSNASASTYSSDGSLKELFSKYAGAREYHEEWLRNERSKRYAELAYHIIHGAKLGKAAQESENAARILEYDAAARDLNKQNQALQGINFATANYKNSTGDLQTILDEIKKISQKYSQQLNSTDKKWQQYNAALYALSERATALKSAVEWTYTFSTTRESLAKSYKQPLADIPVTLSTEVQQAQDKITAYNALLQAQQQFIQDNSKHFSTSDIPPNTRDIIEIANIKCNGNQESLNAALNSKNPYHTVIQQMARNLFSIKEHTVHQFQQHWQQYISGNLSVDESVEYLEANKAHLAAWRKDKLKKDSQSHSFIQPQQVNNTAVQQIFQVTKNYDGAQISALQKSVGQTATQTNIDYVRLYDAIKQQQRHNAETSTSDKLLKFGQNLRDTLDKAQPNTTGPIDSNVLMNHPGMQEHYYTWLQESRRHALTQLCYELFYGVRERSLNTELNKALKDLLSDLRFANAAQKDAIECLSESIKRGDSPEYQACIKYSESITEFNKFIRGFEHIITGIQDANGSYTKENLAEYVGWIDLLLVNIPDYVKSIPSLESLDERVKAPLEELYSKQKNIYLDIQAQLKDLRLSVEKEDRSLIDTMSASSKASEENALAFDINNLSQEGESLLGTLANAAFSDIKSKTYNFVQGTMNAASQLWTTAGRVASTVRASTLREKIQQIAIPERIVPSSETLPQGVLSPVHDRDKASYIANTIKQVIKKTEIQVQNQDRHRKIKEGIRQDINNIGTSELEVLCAKETELEILDSVKDMTLAGREAGDDAQQARIALPASGHKHASVTLQHIEDQVLDETAMAVNSEDSQAHQQEKLLIADIAAKVKASCGQIQRYKGHNGGEQALQDFTKYLYKYCSDPNAHDIAIYLPARQAHYSTWQTFQSQTTAEQDDKIIYSFAHYLGRQLLSAEDLWLLFSNIGDDNESQEDREASIDALKQRVQIILNSNKRQHISVFWRRLNLFNQFMAYVDANDRDIPRNISSLPADEQEKHRKIREDLSIEVSEAIEEVGYANRKKNEAFDYVLGEFTYRFAQIMAQRMQQNEGLPRNSDKAKTQFYAELEVMRQEMQFELRNIKGTPDDIYKQSVDKLRKQGIHILNRAIVVMYGQKAAKIALDEKAQIQSWDNMKKALIELVLQIPIASSLQNFGSTREETEQLVAQSKPFREMRQHLGFVNFIKFLAGLYAHQRVVDIWSEEPEQDLWGAAVEWISGYNPKGVNRSIAKLEAHQAELKREQQAIKNGQYRHKTQQTLMEEWTQDLAQHKLEGPDASLIQLNIRWIKFLQNHPYFNYINGGGEKLEKQWDQFLKDNQTGTMSEKHAKFIRGLQARDLSPIEVSEAISLIEEEASSITEKLNNLQKERLRQSGSNQIASTVQGRLTQHINNLTNFCEYESTQTKSIDTYKQKYQETLGHLQSFCKSAKNIVEQGFWPGLFMRRNKYLNAIIELEEKINKIKLDDLNTTQDLQNSAQLLIDDLETLGNQLIQISQVQDAREEVIKEFEHEETAADINKLGKGMSSDIEMLIAFYSEDVQLEFTSQAKTSEDFEKLVVNLLQQGDLNVEVPIFLSMLHRTHINLFHDIRNLALQKIQKIGGAESNVDVVHAKLNEGEKQDNPINAAEQILSQSIELLANKLEKELEADVPGIIDTASGRVRNVFGMEGGSNNDLVKAAKQDCLRLVNKMFNKDSVKGWTKELASEVILSPIKEAHEDVKQGQFKPFNALYMAIPFWLPTMLRATKTYAKSEGKKDESSESKEWYNRYRIMSIVLKFWPVIGDFAKLENKSKPLVKDLVQVVRHHMLKEKEGLIGAILDILEILQLIKGTRSREKVRSALQLFTSTFLDDLEKVYGERTLQDVFKNLITEWLAILRMLFQNDHFGSLWSAVKMAKFGDNIDKSVTKPIRIHYRQMRDEVIGLGSFGDNILEKKGPRNSVIPFIYVLSQDLWEGIFAKAPEKTTFADIRNVLPAQLSKLHIPFETVMEIVRDPGSITNKEQQIDVLLQLSDYGLPILVRSLVQNEDMVKFVNQITAPAVKPKQDEQVVDSSISSSSSSSSISSTTTTTTSTATILSSTTTVTSKTEPALAEEDRTPLNQWPALTLVLPALVMGASQFERTSNILYFQYIERSYVNMEPKGSILGKIIGEIQGVAGFILNKIILSDSFLNAITSAATSLGGEGIVGKTVGTVVGWTAGQEKKELLAKVGKAAAAFKKIAPACKQVFTQSYDSPEAWLKDLKSDQEIEAIIHQHNIEEKIRRDVIEECFSKGEKNMITNTEKVVEQIMIHRKKWGAANALDTVIKSGEPIKDTESQQEDRLRKFDQNRQINIEKAKAIRDALLRDKDYSGLIQSDAEIEAEEARKILRQRLEQAGHKAGKVGGIAQAKYSKHMKFAFNIVFGIFEQLEKEDVDVISKLLSMKLKQAEVDSIKRLWEFVQYTKKHPGLKQDILYLISCMENAQAEKMEVINASELLYTFDRVLEHSMHQPAVRNLAAQFFESGNLEQMRVFLQIGAKYINPNCTVKDLLEVFKNLSSIGKTGNEQKLNDVIRAMFGKLMPIELENIEFPGTWGEFKTAFSIFEDIVNVHVPQGSSLLKEVKNVLFNRLANLRYKKLSHNEIAMLGVVSIMVKQLVQSGKKVGGEKTLIDFALETASTKQFTTREIITAVISGVDLLTTTLKHEDNSIASVLSLMMKDNTMQSSQSGQAQSDGAAPTYNAELSNIVINEFLDSMQKVAADCFTPMTQKPSGDELYPDTIERDSLKLRDMQTAQAQMRLHLSTTPQPILLSVSDAAKQRLLQQAAQSDIAPQITIKRSPGESVNVYHGVLITGTALAAGGSATTLHFGLSAGIPILGLTAILSSIYLAADIASVAARPNATQKGAVLQIASSTLIRATTSYLALSSTQLQTLGIVPTVGVILALQVAVSAMFAIATSSDNKGLE